MKVKELEYQFTGTGEVKDFFFTQIDMTQKGYLYEVRIEDSKPHYEVFKRMVVDEIDFKTKQPIGKKTAYPKSKAFGVWAWHYTNISRARTKLAQISYTVLANHETSQGSSLNV